MRSALANHSSVANTIRLDNSADARLGNDSISIFLLVVADMRYKRSIIFLYFQRAYNFGLDEEDACVINKSIRQLNRPDLQNRGCYDPGWIAANSHSRGRSVKKVEFCGRDDVFYEFSTIQSCQTHQIKKETQAKSIYLYLKTNNMSLAVTGTEKDSFVASLATLVCGDGCTAESINAVVTASGNTLPAYYAPLYASYVDKAGGLEKIYGKGPAAGGAAPGKFNFIFYILFVDILPSSSNLQM